MLVRKKLIGSVGYMGGIMSVPEPFCWAWGNMCAHTENALCAEDEHIHFDRAKFSLHDFARHELISRMEGDWIVMLDTDVTFEPDVVARLVATADRYQVDVLSGIYCHKAPPHFPVLFIWNPETKQKEVIAAWDRTSEIFEFDWGGGGCLFVRRGVFNRIAAELHENPFDRIGIKGEDHSFFTRLQKLGIQAYCAWQIEAEHLEYLGISASRDFHLDREPDHTYEREAFQPV